MAGSDAFLTNLARSGRTRIAAALMVTALVGGGLAAIMVRAGGAEQALLYSGLELSEASEIAGRLDAANISYDMRGDGSSIFVDRSKVNEARMMLSSEGLPTRGSVGYEIFDQQDALGATTFVQNVNRLRALEGELSRTIVSLGNVKSARVHLVLPERRLFDRDAQSPTASIVVDVIGRSLDGGQIRAIRNLASGAVPGLKPDAVTLLDSEGRLLASAVTEENGLVNGYTVEERQAAFEENLRRKVLSQIEPIVGAGAARVQISADMDFNRVTQSFETFDPDGRVVRSTQTVEESSSEASSENSQTVTTENNLPDNGDGDAASGPENQSASSRLEETVNYEISRTTKTEVLEGGTIQRLSVAVAVDHLKAATAVDEDGNPLPDSYAPRSEDELAQIAALVRTAVGYNEARGDVVEVVNLRFAKPDFEGTSATTAGLLDFSKNDLMRGAEIFALLLGALATIFFVLRPLVAGLLAQPEEKAPEPASPAEMALDAIAGKTLEEKARSLNLPASVLQGMSEAEIMALAERQNSLGDRIDVANIAGQVKASSMKRISQMVEEQPDDTVGIVRTWLTESEGHA